MKDQDDISRLRCNAFPESIRRLALSDQLVYGMIRAYADGRIVGYDMALEQIVESLMLRHAEDIAWIIKLSAMQSSPQIMAPTKEPT